MAKRRCKVDHVSKLPRNLIYHQILSRLPAKLLMRCKCVSKSWSSIILDSQDAILRLPHCIIVDIFRRIPTKKLLQFKTVCKSWLSLLSNTRFCKDLFVQTPSYFITYIAGMLSDPGGMFIVDPEKASGPDGVSLTDGVSLRVPNTANDSPNWISNIVGSCNGLLCIHRTHFEGVFRPHLNAFYILNPITGETLALPRLKKAKREWFQAYGFGLSPVTQKYKLLVIISRAGDYAKAMVLTVGSKSWRSIDSYRNTGRRGGWRTDMVYLNGCLHCVICFDEERYSIHAFNIESERFQEFQVPVPREFNCPPQLGVLGGCLSLTPIFSPRPVVSGVWMMKDYGIEESWTKGPFKFTDPRFRPFVPSLVSLKVIIGFTLKRKRISSG